MTLKDFEELVVQALDGLPDQFAKALDNVEVIVEVWPTLGQLHQGGARSGMTLFGLYHGVPHTKRGHYNAVLPDKIIIFAGPLVAAFGHNPEVLKTQVRNTVLHEIGHHFGMNEQEIRMAMRKTSKRN